MPGDEVTWIVVTGGVLSGIGKGVVSSSIGLLLESRGFETTIIKIDPYINVDAGTMRPTEHGEVFVTKDGGETDQDIGNYERFLNKDISKENNITTGQIYRDVIEKERDLAYDGNCVQVMDHIPREIEKRLRNGAEGNDVCVVEVGGTIGDYENIPFLETLRRMRSSGETIAFVHVSYLPIPDSIGEMKTKPTQHSVKALNSQGIDADFIVGRSSKPLDDPRKEKVSLFCNVDKDEVYSCPDMESIYEVPLYFRKNGFDSALLEKTGLEGEHGELIRDWKQYLTNREEEEVSIAIVGKYFETGDFNLEDSYISVIEAVKHACQAENVAYDIEWLSSTDFEERQGLSTLEEYDGVIVPGGFGKTGIEGKIDVIRYVRRNDIPFLGLCYGMQLAVVEHARNVLGMEDAHTTEVDETTSYPVVSLLPEQREKMEQEEYGGTMRLGRQEADLMEDSLVKELYGKETVFERHRHRYEINPEYVEDLETAGLVFSGVNPNKDLVEYMERSDCDFFVGTQAHPEFTSRPLEPNPLYTGFIKNCLD